MRILMATSLAFVVLGLTGSGCASGDSDISPGRSDSVGAPYPVRDASTDTSATVGTCNAFFCPSVNGGTPCCVQANGPCGVNFGKGCVPRGADGG